MDTTEDVLLLIQWYARSGRTAELRLRAKRVELAVRILDQLEPDWRLTARPDRTFGAHSLPPLDIGHAKQLLAFVLPHQH